jgi:protein-L-isoaspartate(D-aspartate) O-methyltransferase
MDFETARRNMVESQIRTNQVTDERLLTAFLELPRELFVPKAIQGIAYRDHDLRLTADRRMLAPMVLARLLQEAAVQPGDLAMVIGAGTGYSAATLSKLAGSVVALESDKALVAEAAQVLNRLAIDSVVLVEGPLTAGCPQQAPYNVILFEGSIGEVPAALADQLAEGGRIVAMVERPGGTARGTLFTRYAGQLSKRALFEAGAAPLKEFQPAPSFTF